MRTVSQEDNEVSLMLANALRKMDGLIGDCSPRPGTSPLPQDPLAVSVVTQCETLKALVMEWEEKVRGGGGESVQVRRWIAPDTRQFLATWLAGTATVAPHSDPEQLQRQMVTMATEAEHTVQRVELLTKELVTVRWRLQESEAQSEMLSQQLQTARQKLEARETEITLLSREREYWPSSDGGGAPHTPPLRDSQQTNLSNHGDTTDTPFQRAEPQRRSLKRTLAKAFTRKKTPVLLNDQDRESSPQVINLRASAFHLKDGHQLGEWVDSVGLEMYRHLIEQHVPSGERLVAMTTKQRGNSDLMQMGITRPLHCKKLRLAVEEATMATPTPLEGLGHNWVSEWLRMIGLSGLTRTFTEARIDGHMLNVISMNDLDLLEVTDPFHHLSLRRAIQAFRMCGYNPNYLKDPAAASQGSQKLLHWTAEDVKTWLWNINLDQYVGALDNVGLHGALMLLEVRFTSESLAHLLGIHGNQMLICKHLAKNFMALLGPVAAQKKLDAMQGKNFQYIIPTDKGKVKGRGKSKRGKHEDEDDNLLCPLDEYPAVGESPTAAPPSC
jgi:hypothetical protein